MISKEFLSLERTLPFPNLFAKVKASFMTNRKISPVNSDVIVAEEPQSVGNH
jgi:hypothetical protein